MVRLNLLRYEGRCVTPCASAWRSRQEDQSGEILTPQRDHHRDTSSARPACATRSASPATCSRMRMGTGLQPGEGHPPVIGFIGNQNRASAA